MKREFAKNNNVVLTKRRCSLAECRVSDIVLATALVLAFKPYVGQFDGAVVML